MLDNQSVSVPNVVGEDMYGKPVIENSKITHFKNFERGASTGLLPGMAASLIVENLPDNVIPENEVLAERVKNAETAGLTAVGTKMVASAVGAGTVGAAEMAVPLASSFEAGNATDKLCQLWTGPPSYYCSLSVDQSISEQVRIFR